jgi:hypothetical protein
MDPIDPIVPRTAPLPPIVRSTQANRVERDGARDRYGSPRDRRRERRPAPPPSREDGEQPESGAHIDVNA